MDDNSEHTALILDVCGFVYMSIIHLILMQPHEVGITIPSLQKRKQRAWGPPQLDLEPGSLVQSLRVCLLYLWRK